MRRTWDERPFVAFEIVGTIDSGGVSVTRPVQLPVSARVDPEAGLLELALTGDTVFVEFRR